MSKSEEEKELERSLIKVTVEQTKVQTKVFTSLELLREGMKDLLIGINELRGTFKNGLKKEINEIDNNVKSIRNEFNEKNGAIVKLSDCNSSIEQLCSDVCSPTGYLHKLATKVTYMWIPLIIALIGYLLGGFFMVFKLSQVLNSMTEVLTKLQELVR